MTSTPSLRALQELKLLVISDAKVAYHDDGYGYDMRIPNLACHSDLKVKKDEIIAEVSKSIEAYAVKEFERYGLKPVLRCNRSSRNTDCVDVQLQFNKFPELKKLEAEVISANIEYHGVQHSIDAWYRNCLAEIAAKGKDAVLPESPRFEVHK